VTCRDGEADEALFNQPSGLAVAPDGSILVADLRNHRLRHVSPQGTVSTAAGSGQPGLADGIGAGASFNQPWSLALDGRGAVYVSDHANHCIRKVTPSWRVLEGGAGRACLWAVTTLCGSRQGKEGFADGDAAAARFVRACLRACVRACVRACG
jgi:hypothetical protein